VTTDKIYLVGFMAAGKTTVARALGHRLRWQAEDVDDLIERRERMTVADIFSRHGEAYFRRAEREILQLLAENKSNKDIAKALGISVRTVETHRRSVMQKLDATSIVELVHYAIRNGIVQTTRPNDLI